MSNTVPLFPCKSLDTTLEFYRALGFEVTHAQSEPYLYGAVRWGEVNIHFAGLRVYGAKDSFGASLVFVPDVAPVHHAFAANLRAHYGRVPTAGCPRITRLRREHTRFKIFDPAGNMLIVINQSEPETDYSAYDQTMSELARALDNAVFLRDTYSNDKGAARALDVALARVRDATPLERALALAARAEIAVAMGDMERAQSARQELAQIALPDEERARYREDLQAADELERWIVVERNRVR